MGGDEYINKMDQQLPEATILLFRRLAHAKVMKLPAVIVSIVDLLTLPQKAWLLDRMSCVGVVMGLCIPQGMNHYHISLVNYLL